ncbi:MAG TPA: protein kinase [Polyangiales bacterium]|nr:protein kinase [Polyangiales bacterium]
MDDEEQAALAHVGRTIADKYHLLGLLGAGGMGAVYEAEHVFTKRRVALKRMHPGLARSKHAADRFIRESQAPSTIGHPGIVQVLDGGEEPDGSLYLVLELLDGISMQDALEQGTLEAPAIVQIGIELLEALEAAHRKGFIHRDIKPDNIFLAHDGRDSITVKLLDFGIASLQTEGDAKLTRTGSVLGTPQYMSPEQAQGGRIDARSDIWSVGAMLYRALAGRAPYQGETYNALIVSIVTNQHAPLEQSRPDLPSGLLETVERAMRKSPGDRFETAEQMGAALKAVILGARAAAPVERPAGPARPARPAAVSGVRRAHVAPPEPPAAATPPRNLLWILASVCVVCAFAVIALRGRPQAREAAAQLTATAEPRLEPTPAAQEPEPPAAAEPVAAEPPENAQPTAATPEPADPPPTAAAPAAGLSREVFARVLAEREPELQRCLQEAMVAQLMAGAAKTQPLRLDVELRVRPSGRVEQVELQGAAPADLRNCLHTRLMQAQFPRAEAPTVFRYPLVLAGSVVGQ